MEIVSQHFGIGRAQLLARHKHKTVACARAIAMRLARDEGYSFPELGRFFNRDHTTVMAACGHVAKRAVRGDSLIFDEAFWACSKKWQVRRAQLLGPQVLRVRVEEDSEKGSLVA